jgi:hypothetical protein
MARQAPAAAVGVQEDVPMSAGNTKKGTKKKRECPSCNSEHVIPIVYGYPGADLAEQAEKGLVELGGCCVDDNNPNWKCKVCAKEW